LSLFATFRRSESIPTAATDGTVVYYNPKFVAGLSPRKLDGLLVHEVLHAALLHAVRRGTRDPNRWDVAADVVVNGIVAEQNFLELPDGGIREPELEHLRVEEIYELISNHRLAHAHSSCLHEVPGGGGPGAIERLAQIETYWERALRQA